MVRAVAARHEHVLVIDPTGFFCDAAYCPAFVRGNPSLRKNDHVAPSAAVFGATLHNDLVWLCGGAAGEFR
jgi:hypothetical protein